MLEKRQTRVLSLNAAYPFGGAHGIEDEVEEIKNLETEWDARKPSTIRRACMLNLLEEKGILDQFVEEHWHHGRTKNGQTKMAFYRKVYAEYVDYLSGHGDATEEEGSEESDQAFAAEADLRDFLARNPEVIEPKLRVAEIDGRSGIEFPIAGGRIDLLLQDQEKRYVVVELKLTKGRNKALGQLLYYMGWIDRNLGNGPCRGVVVAREISEDLVTAVSRVEGVSLFKYHLQVDLEQIR